MEYHATYARTDRTLADTTNEMPSQNEPTSLNGIAEWCKKWQLTAVISDDFGICGTVDADGNATIW